jgi:hypothetical protein
MKWPRWSLDLDIRDAHFYGGLVIAGWGASMLSIPCALIGVGLVLAIVGLLGGAKRGARR